MKSTVRRIIARMFEYQVKRLVARHSLKVVAVGGSVGKTSTRQAIATVLQAKYHSPVVKNPGYNSELGLPLSVFSMTVPGQLFNLFAWADRLFKSEIMIHSTFRYQILVLELGTDHPGEIPRYLRYLSPDIGVLTALTPEHMANFPGGMDELAAEELALAAASKVFVANNDEIPAKYRHKYIDHHPAHHYYGLGKDNDYGFVMDTTDPIHGTTGNLTRNQHQIIKQLNLHLFGAHSAKAAAAAFAVADILGLSKEEITLGLGKLRPVAGRMNSLPGKSGSVIIDDTYNSSPEAVIAGIAALAAAPVIGRRIAILGSMNELGPDSPRYHQEVGAAAAGVDLLITIGKDANQHLGPAAVASGLDPTRFKPADSPYAAGRFVAALLMEGDVVLVKGSQNRVFAEEAVKLLLKNPADVHQLVRQSATWLNTKAAQFPDGAMW
jgi:UDP-N-acetylmuramyl pentapeptide synthase